MKATTKLVIIGAFGFALMGTTAYAQSDPQSPDNPPPPGPGPGLRRQGPPKELLDRYDANKDGKLDEEERAAMRKDIEEGKFKPLLRPPQGPEGMRAPGQGPGRMPSAKDVIARFDKDKDGKLDEAELNAFLQEWQRRPLRPMGPPPGGAPNGPPGIPQAPPRPPQ